MNMKDLIDVSLSIYTLFQSILYAAFIFHIILFCYYSSDPWSQDSYATRICYLKV